MKTKLRFCSKWRANSGGVHDSLMDFLAGAFIKVEEKKNPLPHMLLSGQ